MHDLLIFLTKWSPYIWLFGSLFGVPISGALLIRAYRGRKRLVGTTQEDTSRFWFRHSAWFLILHIGYTIVGVVAVAGVKEDWSSLFTLIFLVLTPLILVYRSFDSLRLERLARRNGGK